MIARSYCDETLPNSRRQTVTDHLEYNIIFPTIEKTERKPSSSREQQIIGIVMVSKRDFDNVTYDWNCDIYSL